MKRKGAGERGSALLAVLWLSAFLTVMALSLGVTLRGDAERALGAAEGLRAYYLASGAIDRALLHLHWQSWQSVPLTMHFDFPVGIADVRLLPEKDKRDINTISPDAMSQLLTKLGSSTELIRSFPAHPRISNLEELFSFPGMTSDLYYGHATSKGLRDYLTTTNSDAVFTIVSTAKVHSVQRSVAALVRLEPAGTNPFYRTLRWYDDAASMSLP